MLAILGASALSIAGLLVVRRIPALQRYLGENEVAGFLFSAMGVLYGALLAFIVFAIWERFSNAEQAVTNEAADLVAVYRDTEAFPEPIRQAAQAALRVYADRVMATEWASHGTLREHSSPDLLNPIWSLYRQVQPATSRDETRMAAAEERLHVLEHQRHLRHLSGEASLPSVFWPVLIVGGAIVIVFSYFFRHASLAAQGAMTGVVAALLAGVLLLIYSLNQPFTGLVSVSKQPIMHALAQFHAIDLTNAPP